MSMDAPAAESGIEALRALLPELIARRDDAQGRAAAIQEEVDELVARRRDVNEEIRSIEADMASVEKSISLLEAS